MNLITILRQGYDQSYPPKPKFTADDVPDLSGKVMIVTGANTGVGKEIARILLIRNAKVYIASRNPEKVAQAIKDLKEKTGKEAHFMKLDLSDLKSVKVAAQEFLSKENQLHVLFNNAGVMMCPTQWTTVDGYDYQFGTNVLGHFYLTKLLIPIMIETAKSSPDGKARVVTTSSLTHVFRGLDFMTFKDGPARRKSNTAFLYAQSKNGNIVFATELARRYGEQGIVSTSLNPGNLNSELLRHNGFISRSLTKMILLHPVPLGALTSLYAGTSPEGVNWNGRYLIPWARPGVPRPDTQDPSIGKQFWDWCEEQVKDI